MMRKTRGSWGETDHARLMLYLFCLPPYYTIWEPRTGYTEFGGGGEVFGRGISFNCSRETDLIERISFMRDFLKVRKSFYFIERVSKRRKSTWIIYYAADT